MEARITFRSEVYIEGESLKEIRRKWEEQPFFRAEIIEVVSVEDGSTYKDIIEQWE